MQNAGQPIGAFLAATLVIIPLPWHWRARNIGTVSIVAWLFVLNMIYGINSIVWAGNVNNPAPVWCDIVAKIIIGGNVALPIATMCVSKHLELVSSNRRVRFDRTDIRRRILFDTIMCFGLPLVFMALHYIVQGHRFDIFEGYGCQPTIYFSIPAIFIVYFPALLFSVIAMVYAGLALYHFIRRRASFASHLQNSNSSLTTNRYLRLMVMAVSQMVWASSLTAFDLYNNMYGGLRVWDSWANVHSNFSRVDLYPTLLFSPEFLTTQNLFWWSIPASAYIFFLFFGLGEEARKEYTKVFSFFRYRILRLPQPSASTTTISNLPPFKGFRSFKISSLGPARSSEEKDSSLRSTSPFPSSYKNNDVSSSDLFDCADIPPLPDYSADLESGCLSSHKDGASMDSSPPQPRTATKPATPLGFDERPFSATNIIPSLTHLASVEHSGVLVTVHSVQHPPDNC